MKSAEMNASPCTLHVYAYYNRQPRQEDLRAMAVEPINLDEVAGCTCLRARRAARQLTRLYDTELQPTGLTVNQLGLLAKLLEPEGAASEVCGSVPWPSLSGCTSLLSTAISSH